MSVHIVLGLQWGDEGKGKIVDLFAKNSDYVVRYQGGNNAGHTVVLGEKKFFFRLIPSGIFHKNARCVISSGVVLDLEVLLNEIKILRNEGLNLRKKLYISPRCHLILPYHKKLDLAYENARGKNKLGTTKRGIGPAYSDKVSYNGIRVYELLDWKQFEQCFRFQAKMKNKILKTFSVPPVNISKELKKIKEYRSKILPYIEDTYELLINAVNINKNILLEGAHGIMLDTDWSPYPFATASNTVAGASNAGTGIPINMVKKVTGVVKAFTSRVGGGPLPTEIHDELSGSIRKRGAEYGTTTGRPRRIGWLDLEAVKFACDINNVTELVITKLDILSSLKKIKAGVGYLLHGRKISYSSCGYSELAKLKPVYKSFTGWNEDISGVKKYSELPKACKDYLNYIERFLKVPIKLLSVGAERNQYIRK